MKVCTFCKLPKSFAQFNKNVKRKDGFQSYCRDCGRVRAKTYYATNKARMVPAILAAKKERIADNRQRILTYLLTHSCVDCGEVDPVVLEFDHVRGTKIAPLARMLADGCSWEILVEEITKCDVRCANCHRRKTAHTQRYFKVCRDKYSGLV